MYILYKKILDFSGILIPLEYKFQWNLNSTGYRKYDENDLSLKTEVTHFAPKFIDRKK